MRQQMERLTDKEFLSELRWYCMEVQETANPETPVFYGDDRKINRERTLEMLVYSGMTEAKKKSML